MINDRSVMKIKIKLSVLTHEMRTFAKFILRTSRKYFDKARLRRPLNMLVVDHSGRSPSNDMTNDSPLAIFILFFIAKEQRK